MDETDTISRRAAIDAIMGQPPEPHYPSWYAAQIEILPSAQPEIIRCKDCKHRHVENMIWTCPFGLPGGENFFCGYGQNRIRGNDMDDLISRQAAIEALARMMPRSYTPDGSHPADEEIFRAQEVFADCIEALEILPSAQPEILACGEGELNVPDTNVGDMISRQAALDMLDEQIEMCNKALSAFDISLKDEYAVKVEKASLKAYKEQLENILSVQPEPHWIPCSERLPERADNVIICYEAGDYTLVSTGRYLYKFKMWYVDVVGDLRDGVTAWMSLPEPYKEGGEQE